MEKIEKELSSIIISKEKVQVLDQTLLPNSIVFIDINGITDAWNAIRDMKVRGAPLISVVALQGLNTELLNKKDIHENYSLIKEFVAKSKDYLLTSRPTAVNLANDLNNLFESINELKVEENADLLIKHINNVIVKNFKDYEQSSFDIGRHGADLILNDKRFSSKSTINILTICNTGKLAMPGIGTALGIIREINSRKKLGTLYIPETRPYNQGSRLTAFEAVHDNLPGVLISDSMAGMLMQNKKVDCVIVGADRITKSGATANKIGTYALSVLAKHHNIPFYVAAPESTIDFNLQSGRDIIIEERPADELKKMNNINIAPEQIKVWNPSFDVTPPNLIEGIITEKGSYEFDKSVGYWKQLSSEDIKKYIINLKLLDENEKIEISDVADGNLNLVYCVRGETKVFCVKQALPYVKCVGEHWPLSLKRAFYEAQGLKYCEKICPEYTPKYYHYDEDLNLLIMEFLDNHVILRKGLIDGVKYENLGKQLGKFVAVTSFFSSSIHLKAEELRNQMSIYNDNQLCALTEQVVFSDPFVESPLNKWTTPYLDEEVFSIKNDNELLAANYKLRQKFISLKQALIHGDLHSGSIMINKEGKTKIIDSEFCFYGPIAYDLGNVIAHLLISYFSQGAKNQTDYKSYQDYIIDQIKIFWKVFVDEFTTLWDDKNNRVDEFPGLYQSNPNILKLIQKNFFSELFSDTLAFAGSEIIRRIVGIAHVADFETISDLKLRSSVEKLSLKMARNLMLNSGVYNTVESLVEAVKEI